jgi:outer membrane protein
MRLALMQRLGATLLSATCGLLASRSAVGEPRVVSIPPPSGPPPSGSPPVTLPDALAYAHQHQPAIRASLARVALSIQEAKVPTAQWLPSVGATAQLLGGTENNTSASYFTSSVVDIPRVGGTSAVLHGTLKPYPSTFVGAGIQQEVFDFGRISAQRAALDALVDVQKNQASVMRLDVDLSVEESFFAVFAAKGVLKASEDAYTRSKAHRDFAKAGVDSGLRSPIELTRAESVLARFDIGRIRARGGLATAQSVLGASMGAPEAGVDVAGEAPTPAEMPSLADAMRLAATRDPRIRQALAQLKADEEKTRAIGAELRPDVSASGTFSGRAGGAPTAAGTVTDDGWLPYLPNWDVGLVLSWPIFDGVVLARRDASRASEQVRREELDLVREQQVSAIEQAYVAFDVARNALPGLEQAVTAAHANYDQADARFRAGLGTAVELADAEDLRASAEIDLAIGRFDVARSRVAFGRAIAEGM